MCSHAGKKIILTGSTSKCRDNRKTETLCRKVGTSNKGSEYVRNCGGISNPISFSTPATGVAKGNSSQSKRKIVADEIGDLLKMVAIEKVLMEKVSAKRQFVSNLFPVKKKYGNRPIISFKNLNQYIPHHHFKMNSLQSLKDIQAGQLHVQIGSKGCICDTVIAIQ